MNPAAIFSSAKRRGLAAAAVLAVLLSLFLLLRKPPQNVPAQHPWPDPAVPTKTTEHRPVPAALQPTAEWKARQAKIEELAARDDSTALASDLKGLYFLWHLKDGQSGRDKTRANFWLRERKDECLAIRRAVLAELFEEGLKDPRQAALIKVFLDHALAPKSSQVAKQQWESAEGFSSALSGLPPEILEKIRKDPAAFTAECQAALPPSAESAGEPLPKDFLAWFRDATAASFYSGISEQYLEDLVPSASNKK